jgi:hypothetical protein
MILTVDVTYDGNNLNLVQVFSPLLERLIADQESRGEREFFCILLSLLKSTDGNKYTRSCIGERINLIRSSVHCFVRHTKYQNTCFYPLFSVRPPPPLPHTHTHTHRPKPPPQSPSRIGHIVRQSVPPICI